MSIFFSYETFLSVAEYTKEQWPAPKNLISSSLTANLFNVVRIALKTSFHSTRLKCYFPSCSDSFTSSIYFLTVLIIDGFVFFYVFGFRNENVGEDIAIISAVVIIIE